MDDRSFRNDSIMRKHLNALLRCSIQYLPHFFWMITSYAIFFLLYNTTGQYASSLKSVPSLFFQWEKQIAFVPIMIIPYISSGLFFIAVFFMCKTKESLYILVKRINFITIVSCVGFFCMPLQQVFNKPYVDNTILRSLFTFLYSVDTRFNQCPSLHISYVCIFALVIRQTVNSKIKYVVYLWLLLLALSTLLIYQHHSIDIIGSCFVVWTALYLFPSDQRSKKLHSRILAYRYFFTSIISFTCAIIFAPWGIFFLWIAISLFMIGFAYLSNNPYLIKKDGKISFLKRLLFCPYLFIYALIWRSRNFYINIRCVKKIATKNEHPWREIAQGLCIGPKLNTQDAKTLIDLGKIIVFDLTAESEENSYLKEHGEYYSFPLLDVCSPNREIYHSLLKKITESYTANTTAKESLLQNEIIYIHCLMGFSRSAFVGCVLLVNIFGLSKEDAMKKVSDMLPYAKIPQYEISNISEFKLL